MKIRGTAGTIADKYVQLSRDAQSSGDPVAAENYLQHAEHYYRLLAAAQAQYQPHQTFVRADADDFADPLDFDEEPEGEAGFQPQAAAPAPAPANGGQHGYNGPARNGAGANGNGGRNGYANGREGDQPRRFDRNERRDRQDRPERGERQPRGEWQERGERAEETANVGGLPAFITGSTPQPAFVGEVATPAPSPAPEPEPVIEAAPVATSPDVPETAEGDDAPRAAGRGRRRRYGRGRAADGEAAPADAPAGETASE
ncbi:hypothetical protein GCM10008174_33740 [Methylopila turkensis]|uniref:DUF4167 domain-containing protein n=1 Tax=Methylopila turkensis TaxID=1437816 RepID=A0A9W6JSI0_9HYPH|nr:hypothetical protein GCM10008174_33740 [Methylopila turkensis]